MANLRDDDDDGRFSSNVPYTRITLDAPRQERSECAAIHQTTLDVTLNNVGRWLKVL